jgi:hypothetical protein
MKIKKTMSERALLANRSNGKRGAGPENTDRTRFNAISLGLFAKKVQFESENEKQAFDALELEAGLYYRPTGPAETALVSEVTICLWRLRELYGWEFSEIRNRRTAAAAVLAGLKENGDAQALPLFGATQQGWEAEELLVRTGSRGPNENAILLDEEKLKTGHLVLEAKLTTTLQTILRYGAAIRRDLYRALAALQQLQRARLELEQLAPMNGEVTDEEG